MLLNQGNGLFGTAADYPVDQAPAGLDLGVLNCDGETDIAASNEATADLSVLTGHGDGTFDSPLQLPVQAHPETVAIVDLNGDRAPDVVVAGGPPASGISVLLNADAQCAR